MTASMHEIPPATSLHSAAGIVAEASLRINDSAPAWAARVAARLAADAAHAASLDARPDAPTCPAISACVGLLVESPSHEPAPLGIAIQPSPTLAVHSTTEALSATLREVWLWFRTAGPPSAAAFGAPASPRPLQSAIPQVCVAPAQTGALLSPCCPHAIFCVGVAPLHAANLLFLARIEPFMQPPPAALVQILREAWPVVTSLGADTIGALSAKRKSLTERLSRCQRDVLPMMLSGMTERHIAATIKRSPHTVHDHVKSVYAILGVASRVELLHLWNKI